MAGLRALVAALIILTSACFISGISLTALTLFSSYSKDKGIATFAVSVPHLRPVIRVNHALDLPV